MAYIFTECKNEHYFFVFVVWISNNARIKSALFFLMRRQTVLTCGVQHYYRAIDIGAVIAYRGRPLYTVRSILYLPVYLLVQQSSKHPFDIWSILMAKSFSDSEGVIFDLDFTMANLPPQERFRDEFTEEELTKIEEARNEQTTVKSTEWAVRVLKGITITLLLCLESNLGRVGLRKSQ